MKEAPGSPGSFEALRLRAEQFRETDGATFNTAPGYMHMDDQRLLHELEVYQIELEMQNLDLLKAHEEAEAARETYQDLYDFAPVGYFTLSRAGAVLMANLTGASLLGIERGILVGNPFINWISLKSRADFDRFLAEVFNNGEAPVLVELEIRRRGEVDFSAGLEARAGKTGQDCRMIMTDITRRKEGEEADRLLKISTRSNRKLEAEVLHRQEVEVVLEASQGKLKESLGKSEKQRKELRRLTHALLHAQEEERKRISRELHDGIVQALVAIQFEFELLALHSEGRLPVLMDQITRTQKILEDSIDLVHGFAFDLRPSVLDNLGLGPALETFSARFSESSDIAVSLDLFENMENIGISESSMLYRVAQEAFTNVSSHAEAQTIHLSIAGKHKGIRMEITDDGIGIDPEDPTQAQEEGRLGLIGMKERVEMLGGSFGILTEKGKFTTIRVDLPVEGMGT